MHMQCSVHMTVPVPPLRDRVRLCRYVSCHGGTVVTFIDEEYGISIGFGGTGVCLRSISFEFRTEKINTYL